MPTTTVITPLLETGLVGPTIKIADPAVPDTILNGAGGDTLVELSNMPGWYSTGVEEALAGEYITTLQKSGGELLGMMWLWIQDDDTTNYYTSERSLITDIIGTMLAEPAQGAPAVSATMSEKIAYLYKAWRNKKDQSATELQIYADDGSTVDHKATVSDDGTTFTKSEIITGP